MSRLIKALTDTARNWQIEHLREYIKQLQEQADDINTLLTELKKLEKEKQKEINRILRDSGPRGAT